MEDMARVGAVLTTSKEFLADDFVCEDYAMEIQEKVQKDETAPE